MCTIKLKKRNYTVMIKKMLSRTCAKNFEI